MHKNQGFTLLEVIFTVAILGLLAVVVMPLVGTTTPRVSLDAATRLIESHIRYAQNLSTSTGEFHGFRATSETTYEIYKQTTAGDVIVDSPHDHQPMLVDLGTQFPNVTFQSPTYPAYDVLFKEVGAPTTGGGVQIEIGNSLGDIKTIEVTEITGRIEINN